MPVSVAMATMKINTRKSGVRSRNRGSREDEISPTSTRLLQYAKRIPTAAPQTDIDTLSVRS